MTTPSGTISMNDVRTELSYGSASISLNDTSVRSLAGKSSGIISMFDLRGKTYSTGPTTPPSPPPSPPPSGGGTVSYPGTLSGGSSSGNPFIVDVLYDTMGGDNYAEAGIKWGTDGVLYQFSDDFGYQSLGNWTSDPASNFWIRFTRTSASGASINSRSTASTGWLQVNSLREVVVTGTAALVNYTVEISTSSSGTSPTTLYVALSLTDGSM